MSQSFSKLEQNTLKAFSHVDMGDGLNFRGVSQHCCTTRHNIRRVVRALARKGQLEYKRTLFCEDDGLLTAGYILTKSGRETLDAWRNRDEAL